MLNGMQSSKNCLLLVTNLLWMTKCCPHHTKLWTTSTKWSQNQSMAFFEPFFHSKVTRHCWKPLNATKLHLHVQNCDQKKVALDKKKGNDFNSNAAERRHWHFWLEVPSHFTMFQKQMVLRSYTLGTWDVHHMKSTVNTFVTFNVLGGLKGTRDAEESEGARKRKEESKRTQWVSLLLYSNQPHGQEKTKTTCQTPGACRSR